MNTQIAYGFRIDVVMPVEEAIEKITASLQDQGFGVLTQIDVQAVLKQKIEVDTGKYHILGVCNPYLAYEALLADPSVGLFLPCNVIVYEDEDPGRAVVSIVDPVAMIQVAGNPRLSRIANDALECLDKAFAAF